MPTQDQIAEVLTHLADKLGYTTQQIHQIYTQGHQLEGTLSLVFIGIWITLTTATALLTYLICKRREGEQYAESQTLGGGANEKIWTRDETLGTTAMITLGVAVIALFVLLIAYEPTLKMLAPEYTAAKAMIQQVTAAL